MWNVCACVREGNREQKMCLRMFQTLSRRTGNNWGWATFGSAIDKQNPRNDRENATNAGTRSATNAKINIAEELGISKDMTHTIVRDDLGKRKICSRFVLHKFTDEQKAKRMETSGDFISMCDQDPLLLENIVTEMRHGATSSIRKQNGNRWRGVHRLPRDQKRVFSKTPRPEHCWSPSSTTKTFIRNLFLQVKPSRPHFTRQFWTDCSSVFGGFGQSCTRLENRCYSTIKPLHTERSVCANSWLRRCCCAWSSDLCPRSGSCGLLSVSPHEGGHQRWKFCERVKRVLWRMVTILKDNKENLFVSFFFFLFSGRIHRTFLDTPCKTSLKDDSRPYFEE